MKRLCPLLALLLLCCSLVVPALAVGEDEGDPAPVIEVPAEPSVDPPADLPVDESVPPDEDTTVFDVLASPDTTVTIPEEITGSVFNFDLNFNGAVQPVQYTSTEIMPSSDGPDNTRPGLAGVVSSIFGDYSPLCYTVDTVIDGEIVDTDIQVVPGLAGLDWEWIGGIVLFSVMLYCFMKLIGGLLS